MIDEMCYVIKLQQVEASDMQVADNRQNGQVNWLNDMEEMNFSFGATALPPYPQWARASSFTRFLDHIHRCTTVGRTPLDEWSARRRDLYLTKHNSHKRQTSIPLEEIRTHNLSRRAPVDIRLRPRGHRDRQERIIPQDNLRRLIRSCFTLSRGNRTKSPIMEGLST